MRLRWVAASALVLAALAATAACSTVRAAGVLRGALEPGGTLGDEVAHREVTVPRGDETLRLLLDAPADEDGPWPAILLVHGAVEGGPDDARLAALAQSFAAHGVLAASLDLPSLRRFRIDAEDPARIAAAARWLAERPELAEEGRVTLAGISIGGSYALVASGDASLEGRVPAVLVFGGYAELDDLLAAWLTASGPTPEGMLDAQTEGRRRVLLGNLDRVVEERDVPAASEYVRGVLAGGAPPEPPGISAATRDVLRAAADPGPLPEPLARALLDRVRAEVDALSAVAARPPRDARLFLLHATSDPVVPAEDSERLAEGLRARGHDVDLHVTDVFDHVNAKDGPPSLVEAWPLVRFVARFLDAAGR